MVAWLAELRVGQARARVTEEASPSADRVPGRAPAMEYR
jgi:hypothetical protein